MDFSIAKKEQQILVKLKQLGPNLKSEDCVKNVCETYLHYLLEAEKTKIKLRVMFDLRQGTLEMIRSPCVTTLKQFFGVQIHDLSERTLESTTILVSSGFVSMALQKIIDTFPGTIPTQIYTKIEK